MVSEQSYTQEMVPSLRVAVAHPFLAVGGLKETPRAPVREHVTPFNMAGHLPVARGGTPVPLRAPCGRTQAIGPTSPTGYKNYRIATIFQFHYVGYLTLVKEKIGQPG
jgi:hypothetical protein